MAKLRATITSLRSSIAGVVIAAMLSLTASGCFPGRCEGALRGTPLVLLTMDAKVCTGGPACAESISTTPTFHQNGDYQTIDDPNKLLALSGLSAATWFLVDANGTVVPSHITPSYNKNAHGCASAATFVLSPKAPLAPGFYRIVMLHEKLRWDVLRKGVAVSRWGNEPAIVQFYRVDG